MGSFSLYASEAEATKGNKVELKVQDHLEPRGRASVEIETRREAPQAVQDASLMGGLGETQGNKVNDIGSGNRAELRAMPNRHFAANVEREVMAKADA